MGEVNFGFNYDLNDENSIGASYDLECEPYAIGLLFSPSGHSMIRTTALSSVFPPFTFLLGMLMLMGRR